jgi:hypothetical protein
VAEPLFEAVALRTPAASLEVPLRLGHFLLGEDAVEERLHHLLALVTWVIH